MNLSRREKLTLTTKILAALLIGSIVFMITSRDWVRNSDNFFSDTIYQKIALKRANVELPITIVMIDEETINLYGQYTNWDRGIYADLIEKLNSNGFSPAVIAFDVLFTGPKNKESDERLVKVVSDADNVIVGMSVVYGESMEEYMGKKYINDTHVDVYQYPYKELKDVCNLGFVRNSLDEHDNYARYLTTYIETEGKRFDSLGLAALKLFAKKNNIRIPNYDMNRKTDYAFTYSGNVSSGAFSYVPMYQILNGQIGPEALDGDIVFVGCYADHFGDEFYVPCERGKKMYGVEIHANITEALYEGKVLNDVNTTLLGAVYGLIAALLVMLLFNVSLPKGGIVCVLLAILSTQICLLMYQNGKFCGLTMVYVSIPVIYFGMIFYQYISERSIKTKISKAFKKYVAPQIVDEVSSKGNYQIELGGKNKDIAVLFVDIRGFTSLSESLKPEQVVEILNEYFAIITDAIFKNGGTLDKFIGDAAMAVFNSPFDTSDYTYKAVHTAWDIANGSIELKNKMQERFGKSVSYGIGVHCGEAVIGNIGSEFRMDYTAIGDTVNTASRLESNAKAGQILISDTVYDRLKDRIETEEIGIIPLKGKQNGVFVYNVTGIH